MLKKTILLSSVILLMSANLSYAHPGRTDSSGGHTCRTNCTKWGYDYGEYHYHNGSSSSGSSSSKSSSSKVETIDLRSPAEKSADSHLWQAEQYVKNKNYYNALYYMGKVYDSGYYYKMNDSDIELVAKKVSGEAYSYFVKDDLTKSLQYYKLLADNSWVPGTLSAGAGKNVTIIKQKQKFNAAFGQARWYFKEKNYLNAVLLANAKMEEGYVDSYAKEFMKEAATKLSEKAYKSFAEKDYVYALKCYSTLSYLTHVPADIKKSAATNVEVVGNYIK